MEADTNSRYPAYRAFDNADDPFRRFMTNSGNEQFRRSFLTWVSLAILLVAFPGVSLLLGLDTSQLYQLQDKYMLMAVLISTVVFQWAIFLVLTLACVRENTGLTGLGFRKLRGLDLLWALAFLLAANALLSGLAWLLEKVGLPMPGEIAFLIPQDAFGRVVWVFVSMTAGICEETMFRGYLMTRMRILGKTRSWVIPTIVSAVAFGICHSYQGLPGFIVLTVYGTLFAFLYIRSGSIWPGIIAHFFQDLGALFFPH
jgi:membrane protease YdiL (CAAX protease family)